MKLLPAAAKGALLELFHRMHSAAVPPIQAWLVLVVLLPKASGGDRPIALIGMDYRLRATLYEDPVASREASCGGHWDAALRGSSLLQAALRRAMSMKSMHSCSLV